MNKTKEIIKKLPSLNKKELEEIQTRISFLLSSKENKNSRTDEEFFYNIIINELSSRLKKKQPPFHIFMKQTAYKNFKSVFNEMVDYTETAFKDKAQGRPCRLRFYLIATKITINDFDKSPVPLNLNTLIANFKNLPSLIEREFPGYSSSGILFRIIESKYMNKKERVKLNE